jgi:hypothetical protein
VVSFDEPGSEPFFSTSGKMIGPSPVEERRQILGFRFPRPGFETDSPDFHVRRSSAGPGNIMTDIAGPPSDPGAM